MPSKPAISSMSLGRAWHHSLHPKLTAAATAGLLGIEIFHEDLQYLASSLPGGLTVPNRLAAAHQIRNLCDSLGLEIICLQPFLHSEGLRDRGRREEVIEELGVWFQLVRILGTDLIQTPASFLPETEIMGDLDVIVADYREIADLGAQQDPPVRFAFESLCFSTYVDTWELCWEVVRRVDRVNFGVCLDTFNIAGRIYGDPAARDGVAGEDALARTRESMRRLVETVDVKKVFFVQVVDAERLESPLVEGHEFYEEDQPARMSWSRNCRLFYGEEDRGGYLPVREITKAIIQGLGFEGWVSMEMFNRSMAEKGSEVPTQHAQRAMDSWWKIVEECGLRDGRLNDKSNSVPEKKPLVSAVPVQNEVSML